MSVRALCAAFFWLYAAQTPPQASKPPVKLHILVIEADPKADHFDKKLEAYRKAIPPNYKGAKLLDELDATAEQGSTVSLEIMRHNGKARLLRVTVEDVAPDNAIKLKIAVDDLHFATHTTHKNGATLVISHPLPKEKALFLAVTPKV